MSTEIYAQLGGKLRPDSVTIENRKLDLIERKIELENRKNEMKRNGTLPPVPAPKPGNPNPSLKWHGHSFSSVAEFKQSTYYRELLNEVNQREEKLVAEEEAKKAREIEVGEIIKKYRRMSSVDIARAEYMQRAHELAGKD